MLHGFILTQLDFSRLALGIFAWELLALYPLFFQPGFVITVAQDRTCYADR